MHAVYTFELYVILVVSLAALGLKVFAFINAMLWSAESFTAAQKLNKQAWLGILGLAVLAEMLFPAKPIHPLNLAGSVAALVYLLDVRPVVAALHHQR